MRTNGEQRRSNGGQRPEEILAEIDHTRNEMDRTLAAIEHRLTPGQLVDQGVDYLRHSGANEFVQNLGGAAKQNPLPVALTAIGLAWLMALGRQPAQGDGSATSASGIRQGMQDMRSKASGMMHSASDSLSSAKGSMSSTLSSARDSMSDTMSSAKDQWQRARGGMEHLVNEQPLALGAVGLAIGAILGAVAPRTRMEERTMGETSRNLAEKAKEMGSEQLGKATQTVKQAAKEKLGQGEEPSTTQSSTSPEKKGAW